MYKNTHNKYANSKVKKQYKEICLFLDHQRQCEAYEIDTTPWVETKDTKFREEYKDLMQDVINDKS